jgi:hypothetical protein
MYTVHYTMLLAPSSTRNGTDRLAYAGIMFGFQGCDDCISDFAGLGGLR